MYHIVLCHNGPLSYPTCYNVEEWVSIEHRQEKKIMLEGEYSTQTIDFAIQKRSFPIRKKWSRNESGSHVPSKTSRHGPPTALKLGSEDCQLSGAYALQVWWRSVSCEARTRGSSEVLCTKKTFSLCRQRTERPSTADGAAHVFRCDEGKHCFVFCFLERWLLA